MLLGLLQAGRALGPSQRGHCLWGGFCTQGSRHSLPEGSAEAGLPGGFGLCVVCLLWVLSSEAGSALSVTALPSFAFEQPEEMRATGPPFHPTRHPPFICLCSVPSLRESLYDNGKHLVRWAKNRS